MTSGYLLLVEDNPGDARLVQLLLRGNDPAGLPPLRWVQSVKEALGTLTAEPGCVAVLLDLGLPDSEGLDALHALAQAEQRVPIVVLTSSEIEPLGMDAMSHGAQDFLVKGSFDATALRKAIAFSMQRKRAEVALVDRALRDELTGLPRRTLLLDRLQAAMLQARRSSTKGALVFLDLDGFKTVNDTHGHGAGDEVLRTVAQRLQLAVRASDTVSRMGGDEFVVLLPSIAHAGDTGDVAQKLLAGVEQPVVFNGLKLSVSASVGVAQFNGVGETADELLMRADAAMYRAKGNGKGRVVEL